MSVFCCLKLSSATCSSLAWQSEEDLAETLRLVAAARITVVSLPLVNEWTQDRRFTGRTPRWRGITALHELHAAGVPVALASDNTRDQFYHYGDLDMLEVYTQGIRIGQLDRPVGAWPGAVTAVPAAAMHLPQHGVIAKGAPADLVLFRARTYSELLSRPQHDRVRCSAVVWFGPLRPVHGLPLNCG
jgi:cytosine deaminase